MAFSMISVARHQLGTALDLFIRDRDPVSVHTLACGACELVQGIAEVSTVSPFFEHIRATYPHYNDKKLNHLRNQYWNAFKHVYEPNKRDVRDDNALLATFADSMNDAPLFIGWWDYLAITKRLPIAAQVFQVWYYALYPRSLASDADVTGIFELFPDLESAPRPEQKRRLRRAVEKYREDITLQKNAATETLPLCIKTNSV